jgi:predicted RNA-binding Zn ribbon-like protein
MMTGETAVAQFRFVGEHLVLDFVNTAVVEQDEPSDAIPDFPAAVAWFEAAGTLTRRDARALLALAGTREAARALTELHAFRASLRALLDAHRESGRFPAAAVREINARLEGCGCAREVVATPEGYALRVRYRFERPADLLMPLANAAADLLTSVDHTRLKRCRGDCCDMYFLDTSRNRTRTWCDMAACGNRAKAAAYYERHLRRS